MLCCCWIWCICLRAGKVRETAAQSVVSELDASGLKDMGRCMGELKTRYAGRMDFAKAGAKVKDLLASA